MPDLPTVDESDLLVDTDAGDNCDVTLDEVDDPVSMMQQFEGGHPATAILRLLGRSQALAVIFCLLHDDKDWWRFTELEDALEVSTNTLSTRLDELADAGLVRRESYDEIPPHVEYAATRKARDLTPVFEELRDWALVHQCDAECAPREE